MAFALIFIGILLFMAAYQNNVYALGTQLGNDLTGSSGFMIWIVALFIVGAIGYVPVLRNVSRVFLVLILVVVFLSNKGIFTKFSALISSGGVTTGTTKTPDTSTPTKPAAPSMGGGGGF